MLRSTTIEIHCPDPSLLEATAEQGVASVILAQIKAAVAEGELRFPSTDELLKYLHKFRLPGSNLWHVTWRGIPILAWSDATMNRLGPNRIDATLSIGQLPMASDKTVQSSYE